MAFDGKKHCNGFINLINFKSLNRFKWELRELRISADYSSCDPNGLADLLASIHKEYVQYTYFLLNAGVTKDFIPHLTDEILHDDCHINNGIHRARILAFAQGRVIQYNNCSKSICVL